ncbi:hypothetical protein [Methanolobus sp.]|uniref:hypothetical protein n=1 Tax=Methanolobus sp. TaxID=1874737 RepID=UPI00272F92EB|nr:hypothetical protein [Methanolobus sp.]
MIRSIYEQDWVEHDNVTASHICLDVKESIDSYLESTDGRALIRSVIMEAFTPTDAAHMKESKKNGNRPIIVDDIIE